MKLIKRIIISSTVLCGFAVSAQTIDYNGVTYKLTASSQTAAVQKPSTAIGTYVDIVIVDSVPYEGVNYVVTSVAGTAFKGSSETPNTTLKSVVLPNTIEKMVRGLFSYCTALESVNIPTSCTSFLGNVFEYCSSLDSIVIPNNIIEINSSQFNGCTGLKYIRFEGTDPIEVSAASGLQAKYTSGSGDAAVDYISTLEEVVINRPMTSVQPANNPWRGNASIKKVIFGGNCTEVFSNMFENCTSLTEITIPESVTSFAANAFANTGIASLDLHGGIATIPSSCFQGCKSLTTVKINEGTTFIDALAFNSSPVSSLTLPASLTTIGKQAFNNCALTGDIVLPEAVARINDFAFSENTEMTSIALPASLANLGKGVFQGCTGLTAISIDAANTTYKVKETGVVTTIDGTTTLAYPIASANASLVDAEITKIGAYTFQNATNLTTITLDNCVDYGDYSLSNTGAESLAVKGTVGSYVAANNANLKSLSIDCNEVPVGVAYNCSALETFVAIQDIITVKQDAFAGTTMLKEIDLKGFLVVIEAGAFANSGVETLIVGAATPAAMAEGVFTEANANITCKVPTAVVDAYKAAAGWQYLNIVGDDNVALKGQNITMPNGLYYAGKDGMIHAIHSDGTEKVYDVGGVPHTFQLVEFKNRIYGASAGKSFTYSMTYANEGDGKLFYISQIDGNLFQTVVLDNTGNNAYMDPMSLYIYDDTLYVGDRNVCIRKIAADAIALPQDYPSWMEYNWMGYYANLWSYGCINAGFAVTQEDDAPLYWMGMRYNGFGIYRFKEEHIGTSIRTPGNVPDATKYGPILADVMSRPSAFYIDETNNHFYVYLCAGTDISAGLYRIDLDVLLANPDPSNFADLDPVLVDGSPIKLEGAADSQETAITQLSPSEDGYLYWCYIAPEDASKSVVGEPAVAFDETNPLHKTGIKRVKLGEEIPVVELHVPGAEGYGIVPVGYVNDNAITATLSLDYEDVSIKPGTTLQMSAKILPENASQKVIWKSTDGMVATVSETGLVTAVGEGKTQIIVTTTDGSNLSDTCNVKVIDNDAIKIADAKMQIGENYMMPVGLKNTNPITAFQCDIHLPQGVSISEVDGEMDITLNENRASSDHTLAYRMLNDTTVRVIAYSMNINAFEGNDGEVMTINFYVEETAEEGEQVMTIDSIILSGVNDDAYYLEPVMSNVEIYRYELGDANGDKTVNITDVVSIINAVMGNTPSNFQYKVADINGDSKINVLDVVAVAKIILSQTASTATTMSVMSGKAPNMLVLNNVSIQSGETQTVAVSLENVTDFTGFQMDLSLPEGITAKNYRLTSRGAVSHTLNVQQGVNGITRMISYSPTLAIYKNHTGALLTFDIVADETFSGAGAIQIGNIIFADKNAQGYKLNTIKASIGSISGVKTVESTTAVYGEGKNIVVISQESSQVTITNLLGQSRTKEVEVGVTKIPMQDNGIYIVTINGITEKVIIK